MSERWTRENVGTLLVKLAQSARDEQGRQIITPKELLEIWEENRVRLLVQHEVPFSIECYACDGTASGDGVDSLEQALGEGWTQIEPAPPDCETSHFYGLCPECKAKGLDQ